MPGPEYRTGPLTAVVSLLFGVAGCYPDFSDRGPPFADTTPLEARTPVVLTGSIVVGPSLGVRTPVLYPEQGSPQALDGALLGELGQLAGARLTVVGHPHPSGRLTVTGYALLEVNGEKPQVGEVTRDGRGHALRAEAGSLALDPSTDAPLADLVGMKIWVLGTPADHGLRIRQYGVIRGRLP